MDSFLPVLSLILLSVAVSHAILPAQIYWHSVFPNTPMPNAIRDLLRPDVLVNGKSGTSINYVSPSDGNRNYNQAATEIEIHNDPGITSDGNRNYNKAATEIEIHNGPGVTLYFLEEDLHVGAKMTLHLTRSGHTTTFLPRHVAESLPFSSEKIPEILRRFSIEPNSKEAEAMRNTIKECEGPAAQGEHKVCATSLESMVDFSTTSLGTRDLCAQSTTAGQGAEVEQEYTVSPSGVRKMAGSELVVCHLEAYAYAVFFCHSTEKTTAYRVVMVGENGAMVKAVAVCHADTAGWNPGHVAFKVLKVKPGTVPVCHFVPEENVVWNHIN